MCSLFLFSTLWLKTYIVKALGFFFLDNELLIHILIFTNFMRKINYSATKHYLAKSERKN